MSPEDIREIKKNVLLEFIEADEEVKTLAAKLSQIGDTYEKIGRALKQNPLSLLQESRLYSGAIRTGPINQELIPSDSTPTEILKLLEALKSSAAKRNQLADRKKALKLS